MKGKHHALAKRYQQALRTHLRHGRRASLASARGLGHETLAAGLQTLDLAKLHEQTLVAEILPRNPPRQHPALIRKAGIFFAAAITPIESNHRSAREATAHLKRFIETLSQRTVELAASNLELSQEITQRKAAEQALVKSKSHYSQLLIRSNRFQDQLRLLSRQILSAQEEERKKISRELHDVIAQTLTGINLRLASLKNESQLSSKGLELNIARTQSLVQRSVDIVHQFARELRPAVLDDLGLIPALHSFMKAFTERTGIRTHLTAFVGLKRLDPIERTVLFRVAQEALTNVSRHAHATQARVKIEKVEGGVSMEIRDNGRGFRLADGKKTARLGLVGMRERVEMIHGAFTITSSAGGTVITARIPFTKENIAKRRDYIRS
jgi:signal transduction histidine kinase